MKKILLIILSFTIMFSLLGCNNSELPSGADGSRITGSTTYFYDNDYTTIKAFNTENTQNKEIELFYTRTYKIGLKPSFRGGSQAVVYNDDCATFLFNDNCCEINYIGLRNHNPIYELTLKTTSTFDLTIIVDDYTQTINVTVK